MAHALRFERATPAADRSRSQPNVRKHRLLGLGLLLLLLFVLQALSASLLGLRWGWLAELQAKDSYSKWTGFGLASYLGVQWLLPLMRLFGRQDLARRLYPLHRRIGVLAPVIFYVHSMKFGYGFMVVLSSVYLANVVVGLFSVDVVKDLVAVDRKRYAFWWMIAHVALSFFTMGLMLYHAFVAFAFK